MQLILVGVILTTYSWLSYASITDVIDSIEASMHQYTIYGYVQNGYYSLMKYSIRILCEIGDRLLASQKAI